MRWKAFLSGCVVTLQSNHGGLNVEALNMLAAWLGLARKLFGAFRVFSAAVVERGRTCCKSGSFDALLD